MEESESLQNFRSFIIDRDHPCLMAQTSFKTDQVTLHAYERLGSEQAATDLLRDIKTFLSSYDFESKEFATFLAVFLSEEVMSELEFEKRLWQQLGLLQQIDSDSPWDPSVSSDPEDPSFSFSVAGKAFYIVGMHPGSSRMARQAPEPTIVFNLHWQFEQLREMGVYQNVRDTIRERDMELQGSNNPMLQDFGESSETRQYSGRKVGPEWQCPFHQKTE